MSNFTIHGVYSYSTANIYSYLGRVSTERQLERAFDKFHVTPTGDEKRDLDKLNKAMYAEYSEQVQDQIRNQNEQKVIPWASLCAQIGVQATGDREKDYTAFNNALQLLSQSAIDGQAMAYFAGLRTEAASVFGHTGSEDAKPITYDVYRANFLR